MPDTGRECRTRARPASLQSVGCASPYDRVVVGPHLLAMVAELSVAGSLKKRFKGLSSSEAGCIQVHVVCLLDCVVGTLYYTVILDGGSY